MCLEQKNMEQRENEAEQVETYGAAVCQKCGAELPVMAECYPTECPACAGRTFYPLRPKEEKREKAALQDEMIEEYTL